VEHAGEVESRDAVAERTQQLAEAALAEGVALGNVALLRSSAEMFALTACIGSEAKALHLLRTLCTAAATSSAPTRFPPPPPAAPLPHPPSHHHTHSVANWCKA